MKKGNEEVMGRYPEEKFTLHSTAMTRILQKILADKLFAFVPPILDTSHPLNAQKFKLEILGSDGNLDLNAGFDINARNLLNDFTWRMQINQSLVNPHLISIPCL